MAGKTVSLKQMKRKILSLKASMTRNLSTITNTVSKMISNVNSVLNSLTDEDYLRNLSIGINMDSLNNPNDYSSSLQRKVMSSYSTIPDEFFDMGETAAESFKNGFVSEISTLTNSMNMSSSDDVKTEHVTYNSNYNFYSSGLTVSQQLEEARREEILNRFRI